MKLAFILGILLVMVGGANAGGYIGDQLEISNYGVYYRLNMDPYHVGVSIADNGDNEFAVEHFTEHVITTYWNYVNIENPGYTGYLEIAGFENMGGYVDQVYFIHAEAYDARRMPLGVFIDQCMHGYYDTDFMGETYVSYPDGYYSSTIIYTGSGTVEEDWLSPNMGSILVTTQADTQDWNTPI